MYADWNGNSMVHKEEEDDDEEGILDMFFDIFAMDGATAAASTSIAAVTIALVLQ